MAVSTLENDTITDFEYVRSYSPWIRSKNTSQLLNVLPVSKISLVQASLTKSDGGFVNYYRSDDQLSYSLHTESFMKFNEKVALYGKIEYSFRKDKNVGGSAFIDPYYNPMDFVELTDENRGRKELETYNLVGGVSVNLAKNLNAGLMIDYTSANYTKTKDLRHKNMWMDLEVSPSVSYQPLSWLTIGANYIYRRTNESIEFKAYGNTDKKFYTLISFGGFFGETDYISSDNDNGGGFISESSGSVKRPLFNEFHGGGFQFQLRLSERLTLYNEIGIMTRDGYYGKRADNSAQYTKHNSDILTYTGNLTLAADQSRHALTVDVRTENLTNKQNTLKFIKPSGQVGWYEYYGAREVLVRDYVAVGAKYRGDFFDANNLYPTYTIQASYDYFFRDQKASMFPYYRKQDLDMSTVKLEATRNIFDKRNVYGIGVGALYGFGGGTPKKDGVYGGQAPSQSTSGQTIYDMNLYLQREFEYLASDRIGGEISFRFTRTCFVPQVIRVYAEAGFRYTKADKNIYLKGDNFRDLSFKFGCLF